MSDIVLSDSVPESIRLAVRMLVEPILRDVRMMLAHGDPGFHLSAALVLASVIAGLSRVFFSTTRKTGEAFVDAASRYPLASEPNEPGVVTSQQNFAKLLYDSYRNTLAHGFGLKIDDSVKPVRIVQPALHAKIGRGGALSEPQLAALDRVNERPTGLAATLTIRDDGVVMLSPDALYWGVRRLTRDLAHDEPLHTAAVAFLEPWYASIDVDTERPITMSQSVPYVTTTTRAMYDAPLLFADPTDDDK